VSDEDEKKKHLANGLDECAMNAKFQAWLAEARPAIQKVDAMHTQLSDFGKELKNLRYLKGLYSENRMQKRVLQNIEKNLLGPATAKNHTDNHTVRLIVSILGTVILGLSFVLVFLLTGQKAGYFDLFNSKSKTEDTAK